MRADGTAADGSAADGSAEALRPGPASSALTRAVTTAARTLGITPVFGASSTDAAVPLSLGIQALAIGHGGDASGEHSLSESYDDGDKGYIGAQWSLLVVMELAGLRAQD